MSRSLRLVTGWLIAALVVPSSAAAGERVTPIASGSILVDVENLPENILFMAGGCQDRLDGYAAAYINVSAYRGKTLRIHAERTGMSLGQFPPEVDVFEGMECVPSDLTDRHPKRRGSAHKDDPVEVVITGVYLRLEGLDKTHIKEYFRIDLVEFD